MENVKTNQIETVTKLVKKVKKGDKKAFQLLYDNTWKPVYYTLLKRTGSKEDAELLLNEVYVNVFVGIGKLQNDTAFYSWLMKVTDYTYFGFLRNNEKREVEESYGDQEHTGAELEQDEEFIPDIALEKKEHRVAIIKTVNELPEKQREAIYMFYYLNMKVREIAEATEVGENTVLKRLHDGRKSLKNKLKILIEKGVVVYNMAGFWVLRELFREDMGGCIDKEIGNIVWARLAKNSAVIASQKAAKTLATKLFVTKLTAGAATVGIAGLYFLQNTGTKERPNLPVVAVDEQSLINNEPQQSEQKEIAEGITEEIAEEIVKEIISKATSPELVNGPEPTASVGGEPTEGPDAGDMEIASENIIEENPVKEIENEPLQGEPQGGDITSIIRPIPEQTPASTPKPPGNDEGGEKVSQERGGAENISMELELVFEINEGPEVEGLIREIAFSSGGKFDPYTDEITVKTNNYNRGAVGEYKLWLSAAKAKGGQADIKAAIRVEDKTAPVITVANSRLKFKAGEIVSIEEIISRSGVVVQDNSGEHITPTVKGYEKIDFVLGSGQEYALIINAEDSQGNMALQKHVFVTVEPMPSI